MIRYVSTLLILCAATTSVAQESLVWKFRANEKLNYQVTQQMETVQSAGGQDFRQTLVQVMNMTWNVFTKSAGGEAVIGQVVDRLRMDMQNGDRKLSYDSASKEKSEDLGVAAMAAVFEKIVGQDFKITMKQNGKVTHVEIPDELSEAINSSAAGAPQALDEGTLKQMMKQSAVALPDKPVSTGDSWTSQQSVPLPIGKMEIASTMTFSKTDENGNAVIDVVPEISMTAAEGAPVKVQLVHSEGKGRVTFDIKNGRVLKSELVLSMKLALEVVAQKQKINQTINQKTVMKLMK